jgi:hypothetical protein
MPKTPKIHVMRHKLELDIEVDPTSHKSLDNAVSVMMRVKVYVAGLEASLKVTDSRLTRVPVPVPESVQEAPEPAAAEPADNLEPPANLRRVPKPAAAE